jgi:hypothetical protein
MSRRWDKVPDGYFNTGKLIREIQFYVARDRDKRFIARMEAMRRAKREREQAEQDRRDR